ncbi:hypothetical protein GKZ28_07910 [Clostridium chromiireducens]|uniref:Uncharacterized protein n=1 Tax=Clostridium chromiireducens TaxID=225345 RepID=A0A964RL58_9CLOT|nr:hypothetical protein [Clostridium chromiireducens]MVX63618.1 hypothetical protein [Clostridium chromiireducens]
MPWKYILKIKVDNDVIYKRDIDENENCKLDKHINLLDKNTIDCEILSNMEVNNNARQHS